MVEMEDLFFLSPGRSSVTVKKQKTSAKQKLSGEKITIISKPELTALRG